MTDFWNQNGQQPPASPPASPPAFGGPAPASNPAATFANFGNAQIDVRDPWLPHGFAGEVEVLKTEGKDTFRSGYGIFFTLKVLDIMQPGGGVGAGKAPTNANLMPAVVGGIYAAKIDGFNKPTAQQFAYSDLKTFIQAALEADGLTPAVAAQLPPDKWTKMAMAVHGGDPRFVGKRLLVQASAVDTQGGFAKAKYRWLPLSAKG